MKTYLLLLIYIIGLNAFGKDVNILDYGVVPDGKTTTTKAIQQAIDQCSSSGGGTLYFPAGVYMSGTIFLKDNVTINLDKAAVLKGIASDSAYPLTASGKKGFIRIDYASNVTIMGEGTIDGSGSNSIFQKGDNGDLRPFLLECLGSRNVVIKDVHLQNSAFWALHIFDSDNVRVDGVKIYNHSNWNNDGIDVDSRNVIISNCTIDCDDDALCFKSEGKKICENVVVSNCILASNCNLIKFGTGSVHGFQNISISNCVLHSATVSKFRNWNKYITGVTDSITGISGIALEVVDGGIMDQITISNISMTGIQTPIFMRLGSRKNPTGSLKNILICNILATSQSQISSCISGVPGFYIENVIVKDVIFTCKGTGTMVESTAAVPEVEKLYPENRMFGYSLPAYGLYVRHVKNMGFENFRFNLLAPDARPAILLDDCHNIRINNFSVDQPSNDQPLLRLIQSTNVFISGYQSITPISKFLRIEGDKSSDIKLSGNDFSGIKNVLELSSECEPAVVKQLSNFQHD
ncbi:MAG: glycosyl hydrolase family 28 protein [Lentimicrobiaceae bacterium]|nr:glycosyl hydrolase family 28 protein [Lentimicrobiaceae bacterium]